MIWATIGLIGLTGFVSLGVDYGRARMAQTQLQDAVDAAARYAATGLGDGTYLTKAQAAAAENKVDSSTLALLAADVETGNWNTGTRVFTSGGSPTNAVRITGRRTAARGTAIPTLFARAVGFNSIDITADAVATYTTSAPTINVVGLSQINVNGSSYIRRWTSESGSVTVASNGSISVPWGCYIYGDAYHRTTAPNEPGNGITGTNTLMPSNIVYPSVSAPGGSTPKGTWSISSAQTVAAGNYTCTSLTIGGGATVTFSGDVNIYCSGTVDIGNGATLNTSGTANKVTLYLTGSNTAGFNMSSTFYMRIYGPSATVNLTGSSPMIGSVVANNLTVGGSATLQYSAALPIPQTPTGGGGGGGGSGTIATVK